MFPDRRGSSRGRCRQRRGRLNKVLLRYLRNAEAAVAVVGALCVHVGSDRYASPAVSAVSLQPLEHFLTVMKHHCRWLETDLSVRYYTGIVPALPFSVVHHEHMVGEYFAERELFARLGLCFRILCSFGSDVQHDYSILSGCSLFYPELRHMTGWQITVDGMSGSPGKRKEPAAMPQAPLLKSVCML